MAKDYAVNVTINGKDNASGVLKDFGSSFAQQLGIASAAAAAAAATYKGMIWRET